MKARTKIMADRDSLVGAATHYRLEGPRFVPRWGGGKSRGVQTGPGDHAASSTMANEDLPLEQSSRSVAMTTHYNLAPSLSHISSPTLSSYCLLHGDLYLYTYLTIT